MKALLIDDDQFILELYERVFKHAKHSVLTARDGEEALRILENSSQLPDVIILDILMPHMDGYSFLQKLKHLPKINNLPVLVLSNLSDHDGQRKALALGAKMFMVKSEHSPKEVLSKALEII